MSYHQAMAKGKKTPEIEMPPLPQEQHPDAQRIQEPKQDAPSEYQLHPELQNAVANDYSEPETHEVEQVVEVEPEPKLVVKETRNENNIRSLREKAERADRAERERDELLKRIQEMESYRQSVPQQQTQQQEEAEDLNIDPDSLVEGKHLKRYDKKFKEMQDKLRSYEQQSSITSIDMRLKAKYPDLDKVVSQDNLLALRQDYPELAATLNANTDLYSKAVSAYTLIKKLGIDVEDTFVEDKIKAQKNAAKPRPLASVSPQQAESPLSRANAFANGLTEDLKEQLRKEMYESRNRM